jgi:hypothetical protein
MLQELVAQQTSHNKEEDLPELPTSMSLSWTPATIPFPHTTSRMVSNFLNYNNKPYGVVEDVGNALLMPADLAIDAFLIGLHSVGEFEHDTITSKVTYIETHSEVHLFPEMMMHLNEREQKFFAGFNGTYLSNPNIEDGTGDVNRRDFMVEQRKVLLDVTKKTYFAKYRFQAEERLHDDAFYLNRWQGVDYIALPPFMAGYLYYRGLDKNFDIDGFRIRMLMEPGQRLLGGNVIGAVMLDIRPKQWPVGIVGSMGLYNGKPEFEFIGIGTTIEIVKKAIALNQ